MEASSQAQAASEASSEAGADSAADRFWIYHTFTTFHPLPGKHANS